MACKLVGPTKFERETDAWLESPVDSSTIIARKDSEADGNYWPQVTGQTQVSRAGTYLTFGHGISYIPHITPNVTLPKG
ncbi:hypothetical protein [Amycolatopsis orientalis]|uniref:hypothetical protein n=1 Tax=Amycolatopsis orientalis TaxID=31958 RepID=UPI0011AB7DFA|nr:hypothetical protein [Amycolatopsis orientalis]